MITITSSSASVSVRTDVTVSLSHDSGETPLANVNTVVGELYGNVGDEREDCAVLESRPTDIPIHIIVLESRPTDIPIHVTVLESRSTDIPIPILDC